MKRYRERMAESRGKVLIGGIGGQDQDSGGDHLKDPEPDAAVERCPPDLRYDGSVLVDEMLGHPDIEESGEGRDPEKHGDRHDPHDAEGGGGVATLRLAERLNSVGDCFDPGECGRSGGKRTQQQEKGDGTEFWLEFDPGRNRLRAFSVRTFEKSDDHHREDRYHEGVGREVRRSSTTPWSPEGWQGSARPPPPTPARLAIRGAPGRLT